MNVIIAPQTVRAGLCKLNEELRSVRDQIHGTKDKINTYIRDGSLSGAAYYAHKNYLSKGHLPFLDSFRSELDAFISANNVHIATLDTHLMPHDLYNDNMIESNLAWVSRSIDDLRYLVYDLNMSHLAKTLSARRDFQKTWIERQARLANYITATNTIYSFTETAMQSLERNLLRIEYAMSCPTTGSFILPSAREMYYITINSGVEPDSEMLFAAVLNEDGTINWELMRDLDWDKASLCIQHIAGEDILKQLVDEVRNAEGYFDRWDENELWNISYTTNDPMLLLEKFNDHLMMEEIREINKDPRFSFRTWREATNRERQAILTVYLNEVMPVFGVTVKSDIEFINKASDGRGVLLWGTYLHEDNQVVINFWVIENQSARTSYDLFGTIVHELRHKYQTSAILNADEFIVSDPTLEGWRQNYPGPPNTSWKYIRQGAARGDGSVYTQDDYEGQPVEVDAFGMGDLTGWKWR